MHPSRAHARRPSRQGNLSRWGGDARSRHGRARRRGRRACSRELIRIDTVNPPGNEEPRPGAARRAPARRRLRVRAARRRARAAEPGRAPARRERRADPLPARPRRHGPGRRRRVELRPVGGRRRRRRGPRPRRAGHEGPGRRRGRRGDLARARRAGGRAAGELLLVVTADEETGAALGAQWLCREHPDEVRSDCVRQRGRRRRVRARRAALLHALRRREGRLPLPGCAPAARPGTRSVPALGDNALLKLAPALERLREQPPLEPTEAGIAFLAAVLGEELDGADGPRARGRGRAPARRSRRRWPPTSPSRCCG